MSWDSYIDSLVGYSLGSDGSAHVDKGCIIGQDGSLWTTHGHAKALKLSPAEAAKVGNCFKAKDFTSLQAGGIHAEGTKYRFLRADGTETIYGKMKGCGALTIQATKTAIVIGHCPEGGQQGNCNKAVAAMAEYLSGTGM